MKSMPSLVLHHFRMWRSEYRVIAAFLLGAAMCFVPVLNYTAYANLIGSPIQIFEAYIYIGSTVPMFTRILLGVLLLVSDAPFLREASPYEIIRVGKKRWILANTVYLAISCIVYMLAMLIVTMILSLAAGSITIDNKWSDAMLMLAEKQPDFAILSYDLKFAYPEFIHSTVPFIALLQTMFYNGVYIFLLALCIFAVNLRANINCGWLAAAVIHVFGYVIYANGPLVFSQKWSLLSCAIPAFHYLDAYEISALFSTLVLCVPVVVMVCFSARSYSQLEPFQKCKL